MKETCLDELMAERLHGSIRLTLREEDTLKRFLLIERKLGH